MDSTAVCSMTQDYTPHFNSTPYSTPQGPPPLTPTDIFERPRNKRKSSYPSGLINYPEPDMNNGNKDYYMDIDDNSTEHRDMESMGSPPSMAGTQENGRPTYLGAPQDFTKQSPVRDRSPINGYHHSIDDKFGGPSEAKYMRNGQDKYPMLSPTEQKYNAQEYPMNGHEKFMQNGRSESIEKFSEADRYPMFNELTKAQYDNGMSKYQEAAEKFKFGDMQPYERQFGDFSPDQQVPARSPGSAERPIKQEPSTPPPPLTSPAGLKIPYPPMLSDLSPNGFSNLSPNKFPEPLNGFAHDQPLDFSTKLKDEFYTTTQAPAPISSPEAKNDPKAELNADGTSNFSCKQCHRPFKSQVNLDRHVEKSHNPKSSKIFSCLLCPYTTRFYSNMYVHIRTHTGDKPYWCGACGASFSQGSSLKIHIISKHGGNKKFFILDRKLGKANLLRFWQRREASQLNTDNENNFKPDLKKFNSFPNTFPNMMNLNGLGSDNGPPPMPGLEKVDANGQTPNGAQNPLLPNHLPMNNIGNLFPNGMNMFSHMNPLGLNLMGQNPLGANPMLFGNNNLLLQQSLMNGLNLKNSAFFTKTTKFSEDEKKDKSPGSSQGPNFYQDMKESQMKQNGGGHPLAGLLQNGKLSPTKMRFPDFPPVSMAGGLPPFGHLPPPLGGGLPTSLANSLSNLSNSSLPQGMMPMPPLMTSPNQNQEQPEMKTSPKSAPESPRAQDSSTEEKESQAPSSRASEKPEQTTNTTSSTLTSPAKTAELHDKKLRDLRRNVVKMLRMMVPDLQMDKNMNQEGEDVDMLLKEVIWSTATEMEGVPDERML